MNLTKMKQGFENFTDMLNRFDFENRNTMTLRREVFHTITEYKRYTDDYRLLVNDMNIYNDSEFDTIFLYDINPRTSILFVVVERGGNLIIKVALTGTNGTPTCDVDMVTLDFEGFKTSVNGFNREVRSMGYNRQKPYSIKKLKEIFLNHFSGVDSIDTNFKIEYAKPILDKLVQTELKQYEKDKRSSISKRKKASQMKTEINKKVQEYEKKLLKELEYDKHLKIYQKSEKKMTDSLDALREKLNKEYAKDKRFFNSFSFYSVRKAFKGVFFN